MSNSKKNRSAEMPETYASEIVRVRKVIGQLEGVERMLLSRRPLPQVIQQVKAASSALTALRFEITGRHLQACLTEASESKNYGKLIAEVLETVKIQAVK